MLCVLIVCFVLSFVVGFFFGWWGLSTARRGRGRSGESGGRRRGRVLLRTRACSLTERGNVHKDKDIKHTITAHPATCVCALTLIGCMCASGGGGSGPQEEDGAFATLRQRNSTATKSGSQNAPWTVTHARTHTHTYLSVISNGVAAAIAFVSRTFSNCIFYCIFFQ